VFGRTCAKTKKELGRIAEDHAARYLASRGYRIKDRNFRLSRGPEVDIIAERKDVLVCVEVKSRSAADEFAPRDQVTPWKQRQIIRAASGYIQYRERRERVMRFDIVEVYLTPEGRVQKIAHYEGAFQAR